MVTHVRLDTQRLLAGFVIILFLCWSGAFIWKSSIPLNSGGRAFCLFDDAMVSMRYAENLVKGHGPVWNPGERVEGYTNPLMVAVMAATLAVFEKPTAVLTIQLLGVLMVIGTALLTLRAHCLISGERYRLPSWLFLSLVFSIYTMSFWSLMGMETGLVALFLAFGVNVVLTKNVLPHDRVGGDTIPLVLTAAGLYFSRPDALALAAVLFFLYWVSPPRPSLSRVLVPVLCVILIVVVHVALRFLFYGELLPNTAVLKLGGFPLPRRILGGTGFILPFIEDIYPMVALAALSCALKRDWNRVLLLSLFGVAVGYQIYVGGDPWAYWRIMTPTIPLLFVLAADGAARVASAVFESQASRLVVLVATLLMLGGALHSYNKPFMREMCLLISPFSVEANEVNVNIAFALKDITKSGASVGVLWAGSIPFYSERYAVDFLGKCDPAIAALRPELKGGVQWSGMPTVPGHNKYDLVESIVRRRPTYIQTVSWSSDDVSEWASFNYLKITHMGSELLLLRDSPDVYWGRVIETQNVR